MAILITFLPGDSIDCQEVINSEIVNDSKREEIQRYFGYELLLYRYLSLPYDVSINVNQQGNFVDIGILYLLFIPILVLLFLRRKTWAYCLVMFYLFFTWIISTSNSFLFSLSRSRIDMDVNALDTYIAAMPFNIEPFTNVLAYIFKFSLILYKPLSAFGNAISGDSDYVTYPIIFIAFIAVSLWLIKNTSRLKPNFKYFLAFFWTYLFFWLAFSGGIVWYGYILILMGCFVIFKLIDKLTEKNSREGAVLRKAFVISGSIWILLNLALRTSDIQPLMDQKFLAKGMFNPVFYDFSAGKINEEQSLDIIFSDVSKALNRINKEDQSLIWRVGTSFSYFINNNHKRIILDNQMGLFYELKKRYPDNLDLVDVMKANGVKYMIVDLNTASIDSTPDKSLTRKYRELFSFLINNPYMKLLATDRVVANKNNKGEIIYRKNIIGQEIYQFGRFAIFEIV